LTNETVFAFLQEEFGLDPAKLEPETLLVSSGLIDSFSLVAVMTFLEREGAFRFNPNEISLDNMDSVARMVSFVSQKTHG
tara:strand:+ start:5360 stop:5599 length:240 start_codon:yes stop_codon:yes gene_type:complete